MDLPNHQLARGGGVFHDADFLRFDSQRIQREDRAVVFIEVAAALGLVEDEVVLEVDLGRAGDIAV